jgi:hypothetical protein
MIRGKVEKTDAISRASFIPYIEFGSMSTSTIDDTVTIDVTIKRLRESEIKRVVEITHNNNGETYIESVEKTFIKPYFEVYQTRKAVYKSNMFFNVLGNPKPSEYDVAGIQQIAYNNALPNNEKNYLWDLTATDLEVVTQEMLDTVLAEYEKID